MILVNRKTSAKVNIEDQILDVVEERSLEGAPTLDVTVSDPEWLLVNSRPWSPGGRRQARPHRDEVRHGVVPSRARVAAGEGT